MMEKLGRNDPCHCGSGKKYKKCCLAADEAAHAAAAKKPAAKKVAPVPAEKLYSPPPAPPKRELTPEEMRIEAWWTAFESIEQPGDAKAYAEKLLREQPDLLADMDFADVLFELYDLYAKDHNFAEYVDFLVQVRNEFPEVYADSFCYHDGNIVIFKLVNKQFGEAAAYLDLFRKEPDKDADILYQVIDFMRTLDARDILIDLIGDVYARVYKSEKVVSGGGMIDILLLSYYMPLLEKAYTEQDLAGLVENVKKLDVELRDDFYDAEFYRKHIGTILGDLTDYIASGFKQDDMREYYATVAWNFMGYLHKEHGFGWIKADYYRELVERYFYIAEPEGKQPKKPFHFEADRLDKTLARLCTDILSLNPNKTFSSLRAMYWLAEYLHAQHAITEKEASDLQKQCKKLHDSVFPNFKSDIAAQGFGDFPF